MSKKKKKKIKRKRKMTILISKFKNIMKQKTKKIKTVYGEYKGEFLKSFY